MKGEYAEESRTLWRLNKNRGLRNKSGSMRERDRSRDAQRETQDSAYKLTLKPYTNAFMDYLGVLRIEDIFFLIISTSVAYFLIFSVLIFEKKSGGGEL
jgi:hypothetical protein